MVAFLAVGSSSVRKNYVHVGVKERSCDLVCFVRPPTFLA